MYYVAARGAAPGTVLLVLRSPPVRHARAAVRAALLDWAALFARVVLVSGMDYTQRRGAQLGGTPFRFLAHGPAEGAAAAALGWTPLEPREATPGHPDGIFIPHGGLARTLYRDACARNLAVTVFIAFGPPGDTLDLAARIGKPAPAPPPYKTARLMSCPCTVFELNRLLRWTVPLEGVCVCFFLLLFCARKSGWRETGGVVYAQHHRTFLAWPGHRLSRVGPVVLEPSLRRQRQGVSFVLTVLDDLAGEQSNGATGPFFFCSNLKRKSV